MCGTAVRNMVAASTRHHRHYENPSTVIEWYSRTLVYAFMIVVQSNKPFYGTSSGSGNL